MTHRLVKRMTQLLVAAALFLGAGAALAQSGHLVVGVPELGPSLDPHMSASKNGLAYFRALFDTLTELDENGQVAPALAESWSAVEPTVWEFKLTEGVTFSNGEPLDSNAVKFSIDRILNPDSGSVHASTFSAIESVEAVDATTVHVRTAEPNGLIPRLLSSLFIVPPQYIAEVGDEGFAAAPIGSGSFTLESHARGVRTELVSRPDSWRGAPQVERVSLVIIPDVSVRASALRTGEVDIATALLPDQISELESAGVNVSTKASGSILQMPLIGNRGGPLADRRVRQAIIMAVDRPAIVEFVMQGLADPANDQLVLEGATGYNPSLEPYAYDPEGARRLLAEAGYPNGLDLTVVAAEGRYVNDKQVLEATMAYLQQVGINLEWIRTEAAQVSQLTYAGEIEHSLLTIYGYANTLDLALPAEKYLQTDARQIHSNVDRYDELYQLAQVETDAQKREALLHEMGQVFKEEAMGLTLLGLVDVFGYGDGVVGFEPVMYAMLDLDAIGKQ